MDAAGQNKHQRKTEATRKKLLKSALRVFSKKGVEAARIEDVARDAGYTRGAFYANFKSKEDLFFALLEQHAAEDFLDLRNRMSQAASDAASIEVLRDFYASRIHSSEWALLALEFKLYTARHGKLRPKIRERFKALRDQIRLRYLRDLLPSSMSELSKSSDRKRVALEAMFDGLTLKRAYEPDGLSDGAAEQILRDIFDAVMFTDGPVAVVPAKSR